MRLLFVKLSDAIVDTVVLLFFILIFVLNSSIGFVFFLILVFVVLCPSLLFAWIGLIHIFYRYLFFFFLFFINFFGDI